MTAARRPLHRPTARRPAPGRLACGCAVWLMVATGAGAQAVPPMVAQPPQVVFRTPGLTPPPPVTGLPFVVAPAIRRPLPRPAGLVVFETYSPRPPVPLRRPLEVVAPLPPRGLIATEILPDFSGLEGRTGDYGAPDVAPLDATRADDLVRARVTASIRAGETKPALDETAVVAYAACASAGYASVNGFGWLRHVRTTTESAGAGRAAEAIFTLTRDMPEGQAMQVGAVLAACQQNGVPTGTNTGE